jgi:uncharacterized protein DUF6602
LLVVECSEASRVRAVLSGRSDRPYTAKNSWSSRIAVRGVQNTLKIVKSAAGLTMIGRAARHQEVVLAGGRAGHGGEASWAELLRNWLPPHYEVTTRRYILFEEEGAPEPRETDVIIYSPGYPKGFRGREEVLAGGVAAAFNVRLTLDAEGVRDGVERAAEMRRYLKPRYEDPAESY